MGAGIFAGPLSVLLLLSLISDAAASAPVRELWCVAKNNAEDASLQAALDWACGPGQVDCGPIQRGGPCYDGSDLQRTASYAFNEYYLRNGPGDDSCNFSNNAALIDLDPSFNNCRLLSSKQTSGDGNFSGPVMGGTGSASLSSSGWAGSHWDWGWFAIFVISLTL